MTMSADRERDRRSLQDLAKMASGLTPPPPSAGSIPRPPPSIAPVSRPAEAKADDSGIVDLAAAAQSDPNAAARAQHTPLASQGLFDDDQPHSQRPPMSAPISSAHAGPASMPHQPAPSIPPMPASMPPASVAPYSHTPSAPAVGYAQPVASVHPILPAQQKKGNGATIALVFGGLVALSAAAAGGFLFLKSKRAAEAPAPVAMTTTQPAVTTTAEPPPPATTAAPSEPAPAPEPSVDPNALNNAKVATTPAKGGHHAAPPAHNAAPVQAKEPAAPPAKDPGPAKMTEKDLAAAPSGPGGDLGAAIKKEVGEEKDKTPAAQVSGGASAGNVPQKPSQGAVTGALGAVLPGARGCLGPDDPISRASVVFSSNGAVQSVTVSGGAAGKPAEACIKGALTKAKLAPFAEPTYTANITIRHN